MHEQPADATAGPESHETLIGDVYRRYVHFVLHARIGAGTWSNDDELRRFVVYLHEPVVICINDEAHGWSMARSLRGFRKGEEIHGADLRSDQVPRPEHRRPYVGATSTPAGWRAEFDLSRPHPASRTLLATGVEFLATAELAYQGGALRAFVENAFHAAESLAKVELLSYPVVAKELEGSRKHPHVQSVYDLWVRLGNTDPRFPKLLRELQDLRSSATYAAKPFALDERAASEHLKTLRDLAEHARDTDRSTSGRIVRFIATRSINAGEQVSLPDLTIRPAKKKRPQERVP
jgi:hypothetical protein